jgi:hypothetical protein
MAPIEDGEVQVSLGAGSDSRSEPAQRLVTVLRYGPLPVPVTRIGATR